jgi:hypothetical protein
MLWHWTDFTTRPFGPNAKRTIQASRSLLTALAFLSTFPAFTLLAGIAFLATVTLVTLWALLALRAERASVALLTLGAADGDVGHDDLTRVTLFPALALLAALRLCRTCDLKSLCG